MDEVNYLFIDGGYLKRLFADTVSKVWPDGPALDFGKVAHEYKARKSFYYDCLDDVQRKDESAADFKARCEKQRDEFDKIRSVSGMHVRLGHLAGEGKKRRQKEVDVLLAVDLLTHAFRENMTRAVLIAGDRDYKPLVESVVQTKVFLELICGDRGAKELIRAADDREELRAHKLCQWTTFVPTGYPFPVSSWGFRRGPQRKLRNQFANSEIKIAVGTFGPEASDVVLTREGDKYIAHCEEPTIDVKFHHPDRQQLEGFLEVEYGSLVWDSP